MKNHPSFSTFTTVGTHASICIGLLESCGQAVGSYLRLVGGRLYTLGYAHPEKWLNWDDDRIALLLPGPTHSTVWPYLVLTIVAAVLSWKGVSLYIYLVRQLNEQAWTWFAGFLGSVFRQVLDEYLKPHQEDQDEDPPDASC